MPCGTRRDAYFLHQPANRKKQKLWYFAVYIFLLIILQHVSVRLSLSGTLPIAVCVLELYAISRFGMGNQEFLGPLCPTMRDFAGNALIATV